MNINRSTAIQSVEDALQWTTQPSDSYLVFDPLVNAVVTDVLHADETRHTYADSMEVVRERLLDQAEITDSHQIGVFSEEITGLWINAFLDKNQFSQLTELVQPGQNGSETILSTVFGVERLSPDLDQVLEYRGQGGDLVIYKVINGNQKVPICILDTKNYDPLIPGNASLENPTILNPKMQRRLRYIMNHYRPYSTPLQCPRILLDVSNFKIGNGRIYDFLVGQNNGNVSNDLWVAQNQRLIKNEIILGIAKNLDGYLYSISDERKHTDHHDALLADYDFQQHLLYKLADLCILFSISTSEISAMRNRLGYPDSSSIVIKWRDRLSHILNHQTELVYKREELERKRK
jgi:hypothetical protein